MLYMMIVSWWNYLDKLKEDKHQRNFWFLEIDQFLMTYHKNRFLIKKNKIINNQKGNVNVWKEE